MTFREFPFVRLTEAEISEFVRLCMTGMAVVAASPYPHELEALRFNFVGEDDLLLVKTIFQPIGGGAFSEFDPDDIEKIGVWWEARSAGTDPILAFGNRRAYPVFRTVKVMLDEDWQIAKKSLLEKIVAYEATGVASWTVK